MSIKTITMEGQFYDYFLSVSLHENELLAELREKTRNLPGAVMQISPEQGQFMAFLLKMLGAKRVLELGTYTGYSSLAMALALPDDAQIICCDIDDKSNPIAQEFWKRAGVANKIEFKLGAALDSMNELLDAGGAGSFDFIFIDADKQNYINYALLGLQLLSEKGVMAIDNVLWSGKVADPTVTDSQTQAIRDLNTLLHERDDIDLTLVPIGDGLTLVRKK